jgi:UDP-3-O-[3-hydroxymyristoyl] glucosamine N-acyltransferase
MDIKGVSSLEGARAGDLVFARSEKYLATVIGGTTVITSDELAPQVSAKSASAIVSPQPRLDFARAIAWLETHNGFVWSTEPPKVHPSARMGANVVLGQGVRIGAGTRIMNNVVIGEEVTIGDRCIIKSGAVIGEEGFGFERAPDGKAVRLPHLGGVEIEDDVEVGSLTTVCRGTLENTVLRCGVKIDDHVHIAHNVHIGRHSFVIADAEVSGGVVIGEEVWVAPCASIKNQIRIGDRALVGLGAVVVKDVAAGSVVFGNPAKPLGK